MLCILCVYMSITNNYHIVKMFIFIVYIVGIYGRRVLLCGHWPRRLKENMVCMYVYVYCYIYYYTRHNYTIALWYTHYLLTHICLYVSKVCVFMLYTSFTNTNMFISYMFVCKVCGTITLATSAVIIWDSAQPPI